jgi:NAD(P)-dependent dehydrogenase (short-subunit alcohol dehydrogenase family)
VQLRGATAVVTGAGSGIGRATALALAAEGVRVHVADVDAGRAARVAEEIAARGGSARGHVVDVADGAAVAGFAASLREEGERIDILVNNAGVCSAGPVEEIGAAEWRRIFGVNVFGAVHAIGAFVPDMLARKKGHVVNVSSLAGLVPFPCVAAYTASKHALVGLSAAMGMELAHRGVFVTAVCPGAVRTALYAESPMALPGRARERIVALIERHATPPETIARDIVRAVKRRRALVVRAGPARPLWTIARLAPRFFLWLSRSVVGRALGRAAGGAGGRS